MLQRHLERLWHSPTVTTWASLVSRAGAVALVLPLVVTRLTEAEIALWYLFATIMTLQIIADMGFSSVFARAIAYGMGGAARVGDFRYVDSVSTDVAPNWSTVFEVRSTMHRTFLVLATLWSIILGVGGSYAVNSLVAELANPIAGWLAWMLVWGASTYRLFGMQYVAYLIGTNNIPTLRRAESLIWLLVLIASLTVLIMGGDLLSLVVVNYGLYALNTVVNQSLCRRVHDSTLHLESGQFNREMFQTLWPRVWRSGLGILSHAGLMQVAAIWYSTNASAGEAATYLIAWNLIRAVDQFAQAPFYSKLPILAKLRVQGDLGAQTRIAEQGMRMSAWVMVTGSVGIGIGLPLLFTAIDTNIEFAGGLLWSAMVIGAFLERYGAMHLQLYSTTNHIVWHIASGVSGLIYLAALLLLYEHIGVYALPAAQIAANLCWYARYSARKSYAAFNLHFFPYEIRTSAVPFAILLLYFAFQLSWPIRVLNS